MRAAGLVLAVLGSASHAIAAQTERELVDLTIEELSDLTVTSVSRRAESLADAPGSIHVITAEQIRRAGATTLAEALRLAPNLLWARFDARQYAITARGFQTSVANKLLVLVDGRTVHSLLCSGVFWDAQDVVLADIERIEVVSGPGAATWGVNAVNGVINVITRSAAETQGPLALVSAGTRQSAAALRYGGPLGGRGFFRIFGKGFRAEDTELLDGRSARDRWQRGTVGFRTDWSTQAGDFTVQGDAGGASSDERLDGGPVRAEGANLLARWSREAEDGTGFELRLHYEYTNRDDQLLLQERADIYDLSFRHALTRGAHELTWGAGYRYADHTADPGARFAFVPAHHGLDWYNVFAQDQVALTERLELTLGARLEHNDYTGWEVLPSVRLALQTDGTGLVWGAVSRAVRSPARLDRELFMPATPPYVVGGGPEFRSEIAKVFEIGYRGQPTPSLSFSVTAFRHDYERLRSAQPGPPGGDAFVYVGNGFEGEIDGIEAWGLIQAAPAWRLAWGALVLDEDLRLSPGSADPFGPSHLGNDPDYQLMLRSLLDLTPRHELDLTVRHVGGLPQPAVPAQTLVDLRLGWHVTPHVSLSLLLENLLDEDEGEFGSAAARSVFDRAASLRVVWRP